MNLGSRKLPGKIVTLSLICSLLVGSAGPFALESRAQVTTDFNQGRTVYHIALTPDDLDPLRESLLRQYQLETGDRTATQLPALTEDSFLDKKISEKLSIFEQSRY